MRKIRKRKYDLGAFLARHGINQRILGELITMSHATVSQWVNDGKVPLVYLAKICALTKTKMDAAAKWMEFDVEALRQEWDLTIAQLARELDTSQANIRNWEAAGKVPRTRMPDIRKVRERCRCRKYRQKRREKKK